MIVPFHHVAELAGCDPETLAEMMQLAQRVQAALGVNYNPEGYNLGMNLGRCAGAGVTGHLHLHLLPRWTGDTNFMTAVGETRIEPEDLSVTYDKLRRALAPWWSLASITYWPRWAWIAHCFWCSLSVSRREPWPHRMRCAPF